MFTVAKAGANKIYRVAKELWYDRKEGGRMMMVIIINVLLIFSPRKLSMVALFIIPTTCCPYDD